MAAIKWVLSLAAFMACMFMATLMHVKGADQAAFSGWLVATLYSCISLMRQTMGVR